MNHGFVRVAAATPSIRVADVEHNVKEVISAVREAIQQDVSILTLPELCLTGYTCLDLFLQKTLLDAAMNALLEFAEATSDSALLSIVGLPVAGEDDRLYNCAAVVHRGKVLALLPKINLPNYGEFQEMRYFTPAPEETRSFSLPNGETCPFGRKLLFCCKEIPSLRVAVEICEDLWTPQPPSGRYAMQGATVICNPSASDETIGKAEYRRMLSGVLIQRAADELERIRTNGN